MRKMFSVILVLFLILFLSMPAQASIQLKLDGTVDAHVTTFNFTGPDSLNRVGRELEIPVVDPSLIAAGTGDGGATSMASNTTAVPVTYAHVNMHIAGDSAFVTKTLADGKDGQILSLNVYLNSGSETLTIAPATSTAFSLLSFNAVDDRATLLFVNAATGWIVMNVTSVTVTP